MPRAKTAFTPAEYAVLGLVRLRPSYGYELQRQLSGGKGLARVCPVEPAMVYAVLKSLSGFELIDGAWDNSTYPPKAIFTITDTGAATFERWLATPVSRMREVRLDFLVKLYFLLEEDPRHARRLMAVQIEQCRVYEESINAEIAACERGSFDSIALGSKLSAARLTAAWLGESLGELEERERVPV